MRWLDRISLLPLLLGGLALGLAPFVPEPHLWEKLKMLAAGQLVQPVDIFDLFMHASLPALAGLKLLRMASNGNRSSD